VGRKARVATPSPATNRSAGTLSFNLTVRVLEILKKQTGVVRLVNELTTTSLESSGEVSGKMTSRTTSSAWVRGVVELFESAGIDRAQLLAAAGLDPRALDDGEARVATEQVSRLWRAALTISDNPDIGLIAAHVPKPGNFDVVGFAMLSSRTLHSALQSFSQHMRLVSDAAELMLEDRGDRVFVRFNLFGGSEPIPRQRVEFDLLTILTFCRWATGWQVAPLGVSIIWPGPENPAPYLEAFNCPLHFGAECNGLEFTAADVNAVLPASNPLLAAMHDGLIQQRLAAFDGTSIAFKVRDEITRRLAEGEPRRERIALALNISDRTFQRRLREENLSFERLLDATRCDLAQFYLSHANLALAEIAYLLGFADQTAFFRACKRWFGASPGQFRAQMAGTMAKLLTSYSNPVAAAVPAGARKPDRCALPPK
jgi:AraC-like DNA-binding protein